MINGSKYSKQARVTPYSQVTRPSNKQCRICFELESSENPIISPCDCRGSIRYTHERCLKEWILSKNPAPSSFSCDLCKIPVKMEIKFSKRISCKKILTIKCKIIVLLLIIFMVLGIIGLILMYILDVNSTIKSSAASKTYLSIAFFACSCIDVMFVVIFCRIFKNHCVYKTVESWKIFSREAEVDGNRVTEMYNRNTTRIVSDTSSESGLIFTRKTTTFCTERLNFQRIFTDDIELTRDLQNEITEL